MDVGWERRGAQVLEEECIVIAIEKLRRENSWTLVKGSICILVRLSEMTCPTFITAFILLTGMPGSDNGGYCQGAALDNMTHFAHGAECQGRSTTISNCGCIRST